jgi:hypothetical protein
MYSGCRSGWHCPQQLEKSAAFTIRIRLWIHRQDTQHLSNRSAPGHQTHASLGNIEPVQRACSIPFHRFAAFFLSASMSFLTYLVNGDRIAATRFDG